MEDSPALRDSGAEHGDADLPWFRMLVVVGLMATVLITWPLWSARAMPPLLPAFEFPFPRFSLGVPLLAVSLLALAAPRIGAAAVTLLIAYGMAADQTRMQPEFFSFPLLLWGSLPSRSARLLARIHLIALWFYSGLHKLLSAEYRVDGGPRLLTELPLQIPREALAISAIAVALFELGTAILAIAPTCRHVAAWSALALHAGILVMLAPLGDARNVAVWPWNVVLAFSGFALIAPWRGERIANLPRVPLLTRAIALMLLVAPLGFYAGVVDAYPAHNLYSSGIASATVYCPAGCRPEQDVNATWHALNVPLPPQTRLFMATFDRTCHPGDVLRISDPHPHRWASPGTPQIRYCRVGSLPAAHP